MEWISLAERKPEKQQMCIIYGPSTWSREGPKVVYGEWDGYGVGDEEFSIASGEYGTGVDATHWMPLPSPPETK